MKVYRKNPAFEPITIVIETQAELESIREVLGETPYRQGPAANSLFYILDSEEFENA